MQKASTLTIPILSLIISTAVVLNGVHAKDVAGVATAVKLHEETIKLSGDLHHHTDKQTFKSLSHDGAQVDGRSLRLVRQPVHHPLQLLKDKLGRWWHHMARLVHLF